MSLIDSPSWSRHEKGADEAQGCARPPRDPQALAFLLQRGGDPVRESWRTALGLVALGVVVMALVNVAVYQAAHRGVTVRVTSSLASLTAIKRDELESHLAQVRRTVALLAADRRLDAAAALAAGRPLGARASQELARGTAERRATLGLERVALVAGETPLFVVPGGWMGRRVGTAASLARQAVETGQIAFGDIEIGEPDGLRVLVAVPLQTPGRHGTALVVHAPLAGLGALLVSQWPGLGGQARGYLVRRDGSQRVLTHLESGVRQRVAAGSAAARAAEIAVAGVETNSSGRDAAGHPVFFCTRFLPGPDWGLVGEVPHGLVLSEMNAVLAGLLLLDLAMGVGSLVLIGFWRRRYTEELSRREVELTRRHAERIQAVFDTAFDAILTFDPRGEVRSANRAAERMFGRPAEELEGMPLPRLLHWDTDGDRPREGGLLPAPGTVAVARALRASGESFPAEVSLDDTGEGDDRLYTAVVRDVSERVEAERQIRAIAEDLEVSNRRLEELNAQLEEASRLKSEFLANTSHELRTPLNGMIGFLQLVLDGMCKNEEEQREFLKQAMSCSKHLLGLINDVLDIAKIEAGKLALDVSAVDVEQLLHEVYTVTHVQAAQKGITLRCAMPPPGARVRADFNKTKQVLINLVGNSIKFTDKGSVTVRAVPRAEVGHVLFEVVDTGIGIPADRQRVIFEKFTQGDGSTTRRFGGTGLGLAISRSLVELMGGVIGVHSEGPGKGSRVFFSLPVWSDVREAEPAAEEPDRIEGPAQGALVLVVEDDPASRRFLTAVLQRSGYRTLEARSAEHGWLLTRRHLPAVVLLDYALTCAEDARLRTGWDLAERIATTQETRHIPLIFVTGFDVELKEKLRANAFARRPGHLQKPIDPQQLLATIEQQLGPAEGRCRRILLADDDPGVSAFVRKVLPESQYHLEVARGGEECLHVLRTQPHAFDLLVLDLMMPEVSGYDVLREMVLAGTGSELPVLVLTNYPEPNDEEERRLLEEGLVVDVLPKLAVHENPRLLAHTIEWRLDVLLGPEQREVA